MLTEEVPADGGSVAVATDVYGDQARVLIGGDVIFLAEFAAGWRVTAAGCKPRGDRPYDCQVKGA